MDLLSEYKVPDHKLELYFVAGGITFSHLLPFGHQKTDTFHGLSRLGHIRVARNAPERS